MDTALPQKFPFILDRNLAKAASLWWLGQTPSLPKGVTTTGGRPHLSLLFLTRPSLNSQKMLYSPKKVNKTLLIILSSFIK